VKLVIARHCQTDWNAQNRVQGQADTELNATGRVQAASLGDALRGVGISLIVSSDLKRAVQTAEIVSVRIGTPFVADARLRECSFGSLDGLHMAEFLVRAALFEPQGLPRTKHYDFRSVGGESAGQVIGRQMDLLAELDRRYGGEDAVMIIGHGRSLRTLLAHLDQGKVPPQGEHKVIAYRWPTKEE
jgi:probable phosphoglycerate mutase